MIKKLLALKRSFDALFDDEVVFVWVLEDL